MLTLKVRYKDPDGSKTGASVAASASAGSAPAAILARRDRPGFSHSYGPSTKIRTVELLNRV